ncbi:MAG: tRNA pseudouridine(55) synthase TruB [Clostridia bacterium]|nr:tRNA pseudouridine(55) synthase TruB [Clostridia bacterium]
MCGLLLLNKPAGITSFGAVASIRKLTGEKRVGHTGTLDPMATGVLPVLIGRATKLCDYVLCADKSYTAEIMLGTVTDTLDITGKVIAENKVAVTCADIDRALAHFTGEQDQVPPMFSAIRKNGVRLYRLAREGKEADIEPRRITVFELNRESELLEGSRFRISCRVSKGTYIRSLVRDIGELLGTGATLTALCRTATAGFRLSECVPLDRLDPANINDYILPAERAAAHLKAVELTPPQARRFSNGGEIDINRVKSINLSEGEKVRMVCGGLFLGLASFSAEKGALVFECLIDQGKG